MSSYAKLSLKDDLIQLFCYEYLKSVADSNAVDTSGVNTHSASGSNTLFIKGKLVFSNDPWSLPKNAPDCLILCIWVFDIFI